MPKQNSFKIESVRNTNTLDSLLYLGRIPEDNSAQLTPTMVRTINQRERYGNGYPTNTKGNRFLDSVVANLIPCNPIMLWLMLGGVTTADYQTVTITPHTNGNKPSISLYNETDNDKWEAKGCVMQALDIHHEKGKAMTMKAGWMGMDHGVSSASPTSTFPLDEDDEEDDESYKNVSSYKWGSTDLVSKMIDFNFKQKLQGLPKSDMTGVYGEIQDDNAVYGVITAYAQGVTSSMRTDWQDGTERTFEWKIAKPVRSTHYIKISVPCFIASISPKDYFNEPSEAVFNLIMGLPTITTRGCKYTNFGLVAP